MDEGFHPKSRSEDGWLYNERNFISTPIGREIVKPDIENITDCSLCLKVDHSTQVLEEHLVKNHISPLGQISYATALNAAVLHQNCLRLNEHRYKANDRVT